MPARCRGHAADDAGTLSGARDRRCGRGHATNEVAVNYFGHASVASWRALPPAAVLGAMLPDFASMCGGKLAKDQRGELADGVALHHHTDAIFHQLPPVTALMHALEARLAELGCKRGPQLAVGHIGIELMLDGALVDDGAFRDNYTSALEVDPAIAWMIEGDEQRFAALIARLRGFGPPDDLKTTRSIVYRLQRVLGSRPRLRPDADDLVAIERALDEHQPRVLAAADAVMRSMRAALANDPK